MPDHTTARLGLPYPDANGKVNLGAKDLQELAEATDAAFFGAWTAPTSHTAFVEESTVEGRQEMDGTVVRLRGGFKAKEAFSVSQELFKLPPALRPSHDVYVNGQIASDGAVGTVAITSGGAVIWNTSEVGKGWIVSFEGVTFAV
jgi:hypothetical protein